MLCVSVLPTASVARSDLGVGGVVGASAEQAAMSKPVTSPVGKSVLRMWSSVSELFDHGGPARATGDVWRVWTADVKLSPTANSRGEAAPRG